MILQKYIDNPLLYQRRKFDFRCFALVTCHHGRTKAYFYRDGYLRTSSKEYVHNNLNLGNKYVHLVNDAVQKYSEDYGKYEPGNKLSYQEFQKYLTMTFPDKLINLERDIIMQIKKIVTDTIRATFHVLDSKKRMNSYELFGYDFMFDDEFKPFLIEVNSNPSLEPSCNILTKLFTQMLDNTFRVAIDPLFPPNDGFSMKKGATGIEVCPENRFDLIFDERSDGPELLAKFKTIGKKEKEEVEDINELSGSGDEAEEEVDEVDLEEEID
jgi:tubulin monoglycylase TTLL3/8